MTNPDEFRGRVREWLAASAPRRIAGDLPPAPSVKDLSDEEFETARARQRALADAGLAGLTWPAVYGGAGLDDGAQRIFDEEAAEYDLGLEAFNVAIDLVGPTLLTHGTEEQKRRYLPAILRGEELWCQLFSEPGAGSDLASLSTRAEHDSDGWRISGQKVWTSGGQHADLAILVARSDFSVPKHRGLSYFVLDMHSPGVSVRPLRQMTGDAHFAEVFLDDVPIPPENIVARPGDGWSVVRTTLGNERVAIGGDPGIEARQLITLARSQRERTGRVQADAALLDEVATLEVRNRALAALARRSARAVASGAGPGPEASIFKLEFADLQRIGNDLALRILGADGLSAGADAPAGGAWQTSLLTAPYLRIAGGTDEIQRNIIAERILGLPADRNDGRDVPFSDLARG
ncbi:acyl-CoA dehydrogenase family protein [Microbacterium sp. RD1]|uniref:acyl-CoA dehydrogenase family protein n=1 Tax=Microbacterium sp. RD1 TaxID=3457313 RepID=UPI003FA53131